MINKKQVELTGRYYGKKAIVAIYKGARLVWQAVSSCFGGGFWRSEHPWHGQDAWKD